MVAMQTGSVLERTVLKEGQLYLVADRAGDITALNVEGHGLYFRDTRHLSLFELEVSGTRLVLLSATGELNFMSNLQFANDTLLGSGGEMVAEPRTISLRRNRFLHDRLHERVGVVNYNRHPVRLTLRFRLGSDFRDMFEVRGYARRDPDQAGDLLPIDVLEEGVLLRYRGHDGVERRTRIAFDPPPSRVEIVSDRPRTIGASLPNSEDPRGESGVVPPIAAAVFELDLAPSQTRSVTVDVTPEVADQCLSPRGVGLDAAFLDVQYSYDDWRANSTSIETDHEVFDQLLRRASHDLRLLIDDIDGNLVPTAGIPWFAVPFGRDSLISSMQTLPLRSDVCAGTLRFLAQHQGSQRNDYRDEQPGKILHEVRLGELANLGRVPHAAYYGSVDATPLFLVALGEYVDWTGDLDLARELLPNAERALRWMAEYGDLDGDGLLEYQTRSPQGIRNQGWKDSPDSATYRDGRLAEPPIALAELQAYAYAAHRRMADIYGWLDQTERAREQRSAAERVRARFLEAFGMLDEASAPFWAMGLDGDKRPIDSVTSNPGHALWVGLLRGDEARITVERLMGEDMLCGWGLRTLSSRAAVFNPMSYHNGSVWPHDNALIALGMKRVGADAAATEVASQVLEAGLRFPNTRLPELYCGFSRDRRYRSTPAQYPVSCSPQAWAAGSVFMLLQTLLGLEVSALERVVRLRPLLPVWLGRVSLRNLHVGARSLDFDVVRVGHRTEVDVLVDGGLQVEVREAPTAA
jgi:glycogen debranching enzyme